MKITSLFNEFYHYAFIDRDWLFSLRKVNENQYSLSI